MNTRTCAEIESPISQWALVKPRVLANQGRGKIKLLCGAGGRRSRPSLLDHNDFARMSTRSSCSSALPSFHASRFERPAVGAAQQSEVVGGNPSNVALTDRKGVTSRSKGDACVTHRRRPATKVRTFPVFRSVSYNWRGDLHQEVR